MSTKETKLDDFTSADEEETIAEETKVQPESTLEDKQSNETPASEPICPYYDEGISKCRNQLNEGLIDELNIEEIGCGYAADYVSGEVGATIEKSTAKSYSSYLRSYVEFLHENRTTVIEAEFKHVVQYFKQQAKLNRSKSTIGGHRAAITNLYKHISIFVDAEANINWAIIREKIDPHSYRTPERREREPLEKSEVKKLYDELDSFRNRLMVQVATELGPRNVDVRSIKISDVDLENKEIELSNKKAGGTYTAPFTDELLLLLRRWIDQERAAHPKSETTDYLFPSEHGGMLGSNRFTGIVSDAAERAGIQEKIQSDAPLSERQKEVLGTDKDYIEYDKVTPHTLRHTFNHLLQEAGVPRGARSDALDHEGEEVTKEFYEHSDSNYYELISELFIQKGSLLDE